MRMLLTGKTSNRIDVQDTVLWAALDSGLASAISSVLGDVVKLAGEKQGALLRGKHRQEHTFMLAAWTMVSLMR